MNLNKKLSDILDPNKIEVVKNPIEKLMDYLTNAI